MRDFMNPMRSMSAKEFKPQFYAANMPFDPFDKRFCGLNLWNVKRKINRIAHSLLVSFDGDRFSDTGGSFETGDGW